MANPARRQERRIGQLQASENGKSRAKGGLYSKIAPLSSVEV
jgi:hypothetical protein